MPAAGFVVLTLVFHEEEGKWVGECEELGTVTQANTLDEAQEVLKELVIDHLNTLEEVGERENFFSEHGIKLYTDQDMPHSVPRQLPVVSDPLPLGSRGPMYATYSTRVPAPVA